MQEKEAAERILTDLQIQTGNVLEDLRRTVKRTPQISIHLCPIHLENTDMPRGL